MTSCFCVSEESRGIAILCVSLTNQHPVLGLPPTPTCIPKGPIFLAMEDALEKLKILDYETRFCQPKRRPALDRTYFALPAKNPSIQLQNFLDLVAWLILDITGDENLFKVGWGARLATYPWLRSRLPVLLACV